MRRRAGASRSSSTRPCTLAGRQPGAARADGPHLPRHAASSRSTDDFERRALERARREAREREAAAHRARTPCRRASPRSRPRSASCSSARRRWAASSGSAGLVAIHRQGESPPEVWEGGEAEDVVVIRQLLDGARRARLRPAPARQHLRRRRGVRLQAQPRARGARAPDAAGAARAATTAAIAEWLALPRERRRERGVPRDARAPPREGGRRRRWRPRRTSRPGTSRARATPTRRRRSSTRKGLAPARAVRPGRRGPAPQGAAPLRRRAPVARAQRRGATARSSRCSTRAWRLDLRSKGGAAHSRIGRLYRETGRLEEASRHLTAALALFGQAQDERGIASTLDDIGKLHWLQGRLPAGPRVHAAQPRDAPQDRRPAQHRAVAQQPGPRPPGLGQLQGRARRLRAGARASGATSAISSA